MSAQHGETSEGFDLVPQHDPHSQVVTDTGVMVARLGWKPGTRVVLLVGHGQRAGWVQVQEDLDGKPLRAVPRSKSAAVQVTLRAWPLEAWEAPRMEAEFVALDQARGLLIRLPWDLPEAAADAAGDA